MMKKVLLALLTLIIIFSFSGCSDTAANKGQTSSETPPAAQTSPTVEQDKKQTDNTKEVATEKKMNTINVIVGSTTFNATLEDNDTTKAFVAKLPITLDMSELNGNEKFNNMPSNLSANTASNPGTINEGDIMLYGKNCLVLFYKTFNTSYSYVKLGHINNTNGLAKALGSGNVRVTFSMSN